jgi:hypothetical protein
VSVCKAFNEMPPDKRGHGRAGQSEAGFLSVSRRKLVLYTLTVRDFSSRGTGVRRRGRGRGRARVW